MLACTLDLREPREVPLIIRVTNPALLSTRMVREVLALLLLDIRLSASEIATVNWAVPTLPSSVSVNVGDSVTFSWVSTHDVYVSASKSDFDACTLTGGTAASGVTNGGTHAITYSTAGTYYYICTVGSHCTDGQKLTVIVTSPGPPAASPSPGPPPTNLPIAAPPMASAPAPPTSSTSSACDGGCIGGIVGGCFVPVLMLVLWLGGAFGPKCPSPCQRAQETGAVEVNVNKA